GTNSIYFNSVYIGGSGVVGFFNTVALNRTITTVEDYRDNVMVNARSNASGTAVNYAFKFSSSTGLVASTCNYNVLYTPGTGGTVGQVSGTDYVTLASWRSGTSFDVNSYSSDPQ